MQEARVIEIEAILKEWLISNPLYIDAIRALSEINIDSPAKIIPYSEYHFITNAMHVIIQAMDVALAECGKLERYDVYHVSVFRIVDDCYEGGE